MDALTLPDSAAFAAHMPALPVDADTLRRRVELMFAALKPNSRLALLQDWRTVSRWCTKRGFASLPMTMDALADFCRDQGRSGRSETKADVAGTYVRVTSPKALASIRRYVASVHRWHARLGLACPTDVVEWPDTWKAIRLELGVRPQRQARALTWEILSAALSALPDTTRNRRDIALVTLMYDGLLRESEVVGLRREHFVSSHDGGGTFAFDDSKTGAGRSRVNPDTLRRLRAWLERSPGTEGPLFVALPRAVRRTGGLDAVVPVVTSDAGLHARDIDAIVRRVLQQSGLRTQAFSGHSLRVGACQDMFAAQLELPAIMDEGRWKTTAMPVRYAAGLDKRRGASAQLAKKLGRA